MITVRFYPRVSPKTDTGHTLASPAAFWGKGWLGKCHRQKKSAEVTATSADYLLFCSASGRASGGSGQETVLRMRRQAAESVYHPAKSKRDYGHFLLFVSAFYDMLSKRHTIMSCNPEEKSINSAWRGLL